MSSTSFQTKTFTVTNPDSRIRRPDDLMQFVTFAAGDDIPPGKRVGDPKLIPIGTTVKVTDVRLSNRTVFALTQSEANPPRACCPEITIDLAAQLHGAHSVENERALRGEKVFASPVNPSLGTWLRSPGSCDRTPRYNHRRT